MKKFFVFTFSLGLFSLSVSSSQAYYFGINYSGQTNQVRFYTLSGFPYTSYGLGWYGYSSFGRGVDTSRYRANLHRHMELNKRIERLLAEKQQRYFSENIAEKDRLRLAAEQGRPLVPQKPLEQAPKDIPPIERLPSPDLEKEFHEQSAPDNKEPEIITAASQPGRLE